MSFPNKLKALRKEYNMTQEHVAEQLNLNRSTISGYETKDRQPCYQTLAALADLFHVTIDYLLDDDVVTLDNSQNVTLSGSEEQLMAGYRKLSPESQCKLIEYMKLLEMTEKNTEQ